MTSTTSHPYQFDDTYSECLYHTSVADKIHYIGSRAIFDPNFVPPHFNPRVKKAQLIQGTISNAIEDEYSTNINLYGLKGSGKNLHINHFLDWLEHSGMNSSNSISTKPLHIIRVDCSQKDLGQLFFGMINELGKFLGLKLNLSDIMQMTPANQWNSFKLLIQKVKAPIIMYLHETEQLEPQYISKIFNFAKEAKNLQIITSINTGVQRYSFRQYNAMDHKIRMDTYETGELLNIVDQRSTMAFQNGLSVDTQKMVVDLVSEFDMQVPGSCVKMLCEINPIIQQKGDVTSEDLRELSQYFFDSYNIDSLSMADFVMNTSIEDRLFLDYLIGYFRLPSQFFIPFQEIKNAYRMSCEELGAQTRNKQFLQSFSKITKAHILRPCRHAITNNISRIQGVVPGPHLLTLPIK
ncbi:MAG: hypothetical protein ACTSVU_03500, partial [Promethearchaeota archaeon]